MTKLDFNRQTGRYKNSKNKGPSKTLMALQTNALMSTFRYLCTTIKKTKFDNYFALPFDIKQVASILMKDKERV